MRYRRQGIEIIMDILEISLNGAKKTHIMHKANLNFSMLRRYLQQLLSKGLLEKIDNPYEDDYYKTTDKGREVLKIYKALRARIG
jgi:predicted transcriptional regulator